MATETQDSPEMDEPTEKPRQPERRTERPREEPPDAETLRAENERLRFEHERTQAALKKANKEAEERRRRLEDIDRAEEERKAASLSEMDKLKRDASEQARARQAAEDRATALEAQLSRQRIDTAVERAAATMGWEYPDIAPSLIDRRRVTEDPETLKIDGIKQELERLVKDKPGLLGAARGGGSPPREGPRRGGGNPQNPRDRGPDLEADLRATGNYV